MNTALSLTPLLRNSVGFDRIHELFESVLNTDEAAGSYPPYNIEKHGEDDYLIAMAVAGFQQTDLEITVQNDQLIVTGRLKEESRDGVEYLHRGIATRAFQRSFRLAENMRVTGASIKDGLLSIQLVRELPEGARPRRIPIRNTLDQSAEGIEAIEAEERKKVG